MGDIPILGDIIGIGEDITDVAKILFEFFKDFKLIINLFLSGVNLVKEIILGGITFAKTTIDILLNSLDLLNSFLELLQFVSKLIIKYLHVPFIYVYLVPFFFAVYYLIQILDIIFL